MSESKDLIDYIIKITPQLNSIQLDELSLKISKLITETEKKERERVLNNLKREER